jgi:hypothetical protein
MSNDKEKSTGIDESKPSKKCFVIMPISDVDGYIPGHFDRVFDYLIKPACERAGFEAIRADKTSKANLIVLDILKKIIESDVVLCDLSSNNPNVLYELGIRQAFDRTTVLIKDKKTSKIFDIDGIRRLEYDESLRVDTVEYEIEDIVLSINETYSNNKKDGNSLIQLLRIDPASMPESVKLQGDTSVLFNAISALSSKIDYINNRIQYKNAYENDSHEWITDKAMKKDIMNDYIGKLDYNNMFTAEFAAIQNIIDQKNSNSRNKKE